MKKVLVKAYIPHEVKTLLENLALETGDSISTLVLAAVVNTYLSKPSSRSNKHSQTVDNEVPQKTKIVNHHRSSPVVGLLLGKEHPDVMNSDISVGVLYIDRLLERFGMNPSGSVKARCFQLGGRDGSLFRGSLTHATKVEEWTSKHDPDGLPWFPRDETRLFWEQMTAVEYVRQRLEKP